MTTGQATALADWVEAHRKRLTTVYITHGHPDHWFGLSVILRRFPGARAVALPAVVERMREAAAGRALGDFLLPGKIAAELPIAQPLLDSNIEIEGHALIAIGVGHTDGDDTTALHVPEIGLVVAGDAIYNDVHQYLADSDHEGRLAWLTAIDRIAALAPKALIAGHQRAGRPDGPELIAETRQYIVDFDRIAATASTRRELYDRMLDLYPTRLNPSTLWYAARTLKPAGAEATV